MFAHAHMPGKHAHDQLLARVVRQQYSKALPIGRRGATLRVMIIRQSHDWGVHGSPTRGCTVPQASMTSEESE
jgi:hypothetical protein